MPDDLRMRSAADKKSAGTRLRALGFDRAHDPEIGVAERLEPGLVVVTAPNAGPMTFTGTRTYILGTREVAIIDPGPKDPEHAAALAGALPPGARVRAVLVTHAHRDHSAGAEAIGRLFDAPVLGHGDPRGARSPLMTELAAAGGLGGGEGLDYSFAPDRAIRGGELLRGLDWTIEVLALPGHTADHLGFAWLEGGALFTGDTVMGWSTTLISPPDGDLGGFRTTLRRLQKRQDRIYYPGHGAPAAYPQALAGHILGHRAQREQEILDELAEGPAGVTDLVARLYADVDPRLHPAAARNVLAHLIDLTERGGVRSDGTVGPGARYAAV